MSELYDKINSDLKKAMINKDQRRTSVLKMLKSAILYAGVDSGSRDDISDEQILEILKKESKKRREAYELYAKAGDSAREAEERYEKEVVDEYLPEMLSEAEVANLVDKVIGGMDEVSPKTMGKIIAEVRNESNGLADGALIAKLVKERINR